MIERRAKQRARGPERRALDPSQEPMRRGGGLRRLPDLLGRVLDPAARRRGLAEARLLTEWPAIVGPALAAHSQPVRLSHRPDLRGGVLSLHVAGAAALELQHSEPQVLERINGFFGYPAVVRLHLIQAPLRRPGRRQLPAPSPRLSGAEESAIAAAVAATVEDIADPGLQAALAALGRTLRTRPGDLEVRPTRARRPADVALAR
jgi:hypothetical protein